MVNGKCVKTYSKGGRLDRGKHAKEYEFFYSTFQCPCCCWSGSCLIPISDKSYQKDCEVTNRWWDTDFISGFAQLVAHEAHTSYQASRVQLIHCPHPNTSPEESECRDLRKGTEVIVSVLHDVEVLANTITVHDGLKRPMQRWHNHIVNILKRCKLIDRETEFIWSKKGGDYIDSYDLLPKRDRAHGGENHDDQDQQWYV